MTSEQHPSPAHRAAPALWLTVAFNLFALFVTVLVTVLVRVDWPAWLPLASLALSGGVGAACLALQQTRRIGVGMLGGTAMSILAFLILFVIFFVTYFIVPGGHELS